MTISRDKIVQHILGMFIGAMILFAGTVLYQSLVDFDPPSRTENDKISHAYIGKVSFLLFERDIHIDKTYTGRITRRLVKMPGEIPQYILPETSQIYHETEAGAPLKIRRIIELSHRLPPGEYCAISTLHWWPELSLVPHAKDLPYVCFEAKE